jgi:histidinol-phosphatase
VSQESLKRRMEVAGDAAWKAGRATLRYFQTDLAVELKADRSPVTAADRETEALLVELIAREYPGDGFLGEEHGERRGSSGYRWVLDPIDGTKSFIQGVPLYGVLVALESPEREPLVGAVCLPALGELVVAARGEGCYWNGRRARVSAVSSLAAACVVYTGDDSFGASGTMAVKERIGERVRVMRGWGDCYGHVLVATGRADAMLDPILGDWDCAPLLPIVEEAGGVFTDWQGRRTILGKSAISSNAAIAAELRAIVRGGA